MWERSTHHTRLPAFHTRPIISRTCVSWLLLRPSSRSALWTRCFPSTWDDMKSSLLWICYSLDWPDFIHDNCPANSHMYIAVAYTYEYDLNVCMRVCMYVSIYLSIYLLCMKSPIVLMTSGNSSCFLRLKCLILRWKRQVSTKHQQNANKISGVEHLGD